MLHVCTSVDKSSKLCVLLRCDHRLFAAFLFIYLIIDFIVLCVSPSSWPQFFNCKDNSKFPITRRTSLESLCFVAPDVILPPSNGLKLNQLSAKLFFSIVNSNLFTRKRLFQVAGNPFPLNYLDAITSLCTPIVYWTDMLRNIKFRTLR